MYSREEGGLIDQQKMAMKRLMILTFVSILFIPVLAPGETWKIDRDRSSFQFQVRYMVVSEVKGEFHKATGAAAMDDNDIGSLKVEIEIDAASVDTGDAKRDEFLRGEDFFYVAK